MDSTNEDRGEEISISMGSPDYNQVAAGKWLHRAP